MLFRPSYDDGNELNIAKKYFNVHRYRSTIPNDSTVIGRYSTLPYYDELEQDLLHNNSKLINSYYSHRWIADFEYYESFKDITPQSWSEHEFPYSTYNGPFVVKGKTNSKKLKWNTHMFAEDRRKAVEIAAELMCDPYISQQGVIYREYVPLKTYEIDSVCGVHYSNEWRFFYYKNIRLSYGYYWSIASDPSGEMDNVGLELAQKIADIASQHVNFFVVDIAQKEDGGWILIELNDGQQSGLSENDPDVLYYNLAKAINNDKL